MKNTEKVLLRNEITIQLSRAKVTVNMLKQVKKEEREEFIDIKLLEINDASLRWALQKQVVTQSELTTDKFYISNKHLNKNVVEGAIATTGMVGSGYAFSVVTAPTFLGFGGGFGVIGAAGAATIAAPLILASLGVYGVIKYKEHEKYENLIEYFESEKKKILNFYIERIDSLKLLDK